MNRTVPAPAAALLIAVLAMAAQIVTAVPAAADEAGSAASGLRDLAGNGRYQLLDVNERILRLDTGTGTFDICSLRGGSWDCRVAEDRADEIDRELAMMSMRIERLELALAEARSAAETPVAGDGILARIAALVPLAHWR